MSLFPSLVSRLVLRDAVCHCDPYLRGFSLVIRPGPDNCLPRNWEASVSIKPFIHTRKRQTLQYLSPGMEHVARVLQEATGDQPLNPRPEWGVNYRESPCTDYGTQVKAICDRQSLEAGRPWKIEQRHLNGVRRELDKLFRVLNSIIRQEAAKTGKDLRAPPDYHKRAMKFSGSKREHYIQCAEEQAEHPLRKRRNEIYHECSGKWGELSARPRVLLVQTIRARGTKRVKPNTPLRVPIAVEGYHRDYYEDALHHYCHANGWPNVASGSSLRKRGRMIADMVEPGDLVLSLDWSKFDGTLGQLGVEEREAFLRASRQIFGDNPDLDAVIHTQNFNTVKGGPISGKLYGNRGSGTAGTSTGNKCVVLAAIAYCLGPAFGGRRGVKLYCDGDDTLIIVPPRWRGENDRWIHSWCRRFSALGLITKIQQSLEGERASVVERTRFCRAGVIETKSGHLLCKEPLDALYVFTNYRKHFRGGRFKDYLQTLSVGIRNTYGEVPILCAFADMFDVGGRYDESLNDSSGIERMMAVFGGKATTEVTAAARDSFFRTFNVAPSAQLMCEELIRAERPRFRALLA